MLVARTRAALSSVPESADAWFAEAMKCLPIAMHVDDANAQHYELPARFFELVLGPKLKYSCGLYEAPAGASTTLEAAEVAALNATIAHADIADGHRILELGCGWGSLSLHLAERFPAAFVTAVSNSQSQRAFIEVRALQRGIRNLRVLTADMNDVAFPENAFDRVVSVEMFEHMSNWRELLARLRRWLVPSGRLFLHVFSHRRAAYRFDRTDRADWIARHFFTGGIMPSHGLAYAFPDLFSVEDTWRWDGRHYARTAEDWLCRMDANRSAIGEVMRETYGVDAALWQRRWRLFFLTTAGLFGHAGGGEWGVSHYRLRPTLSRGDGRQPSANTTAGGSARVIPQQRASAGHTVAQSESGSDAETSPDSR
jgi:cyclopropane-fatty-acyl-phospholipid synthase